MYAQTADGARVATEREAILLYLYVRRYLTLSYSKSRILVDDRTLLDVM